MLLKIANELNTPLEIETTCFSQIKELKKEIVKKLEMDESIFESHCNFIYKNFILNEDKILKFYRIDSGCEIWVGKIENYLKKREIVLEVFIGKSIPELNFLIVNDDAPISYAITILEGIFSEFIVTDIWTIDGDRIERNQRICDIDRVNEYQKIFLNLPDEANRTFEDCCKLHDIFFLEKYCMNYQDDFLRFENCFVMNPESRRITENFLEYVMGPVSFKCQELDEKMCNAMKCVQNSKFLFSLRMADRIFSTVKILWKSMEYDFEKNHVGKYNLNPFDISRVFDRFDDYFQISLLMSVTNFQITRHEGGADKSIRNIVEDAAQYMTCKDTDWNILVKKYLKEFVSKTFNLQEYLKIIYNQPTITWKTADGCFDIVKLPKNIYTVVDLKTEVSRLLGTTKEYLCFIRDGETKDEDIFDLNETKDYHIVIILSMENVEILKKLGVGAFAEVRLCKNKLSGQEFALKIPKKVNEILSEISIFDKVKYCPPLISFYGLYLHLGVMCIAMEYISGETLESILKDKNLDISLKFEFIFQTLQQIKALHDQEIIHRDISCNNILIYNDNRNAKLIDFGLSLSVRGMNPEDIVLYTEVGTSFYMAPELLKHQPYSNKIDIWSFGVVAAKVFSGKRPYSNLSVSEFIVKIAGDKTIKLDPEMFTKDVFDFLSPCFKSDPKERPTVDDLLGSSIIQKKCSKQIFRIS